jgi:6-phosphogluconolactonase
VAFLASGTDKAQVLRTVLEEDAPLEQYPAKLVRPSNGRLMWFVDRAAASQLTSTK